MKYYVLIFVAGLMIACGGQSSHHDHSETAVEDSTNTNKILYNQVMDIHDEAMPKMETLYNLKKDLQEKAAATPNMVAEESSKIQQRIAALDSVGKMMNDWMHSFEMPDSTDSEQTRAYLETQLEEVKRVREAMNTVIEKEKTGH
jgi:hypothetical protein